MVSTCANPECSKSFQRLRQGRLYLIDPREHPNNQAGWPSSHLEFFWLCEHCAPRFRLAFGPGNHVSCVARPECDPVMDKRVVSG